MEWKLIADYGVALGLLLLFAAAVWRVLLWLGRHVVLPVVQSHIEFLRAIQGSLQQQHTLLERTHQQLSALAELIKQQQDWMVGHEERMVQVIRDDPSMRCMAATSHEKQHRT